MSKHDIGRGTAIWVIVCALFFGYVGCATFFEEASKGNWNGALGGIFLAPILWWVFSRLGALAYNVLFVAGQVLDAQVTHGKEIRGDDE